MKKILLLFTFITISTNLYSQNISPYFPQKAVIRTSNKYETQMTYFELNFVSIKLQDFMSYKFAMTLNDEKTKYELKNGVGNITFVFTDKIAMNKNPRKLYFKFNVFQIDKELVIKKLEITGDPDTVLRFYVSYWSTSLNFEDVSKTEIVSNRLLQDRISYSFNSGHPYIKVKNTTIKSPEKFVDNYKAKKTKYDKNEKERLAKKQAEKKERMKKLKKEAKVKEKERNTRVNKFEYQVVKKKRNLKYQQTNRYFADKNAEKIRLEKKFNDFLSDKKRGTYIIEVSYTKIYDKLKSTDLKIKSYTKPKGFFSKVKEVVKH